MVTVRRDGGSISPKLSEAAHLIIARSPQGATKLNKILWAADCEYYFRHGRSLTGETNYIRRDYGPCPINIEGILAELKRDGAIQEHPQPVGVFVQREITHIREPDIHLLSANEVDILLSVAHNMSKLTAKQASNQSHTDLWKATPNGGLMSVEAGSVRVDFTPEVADWAQSAFAAE